MFIDRYQLSDPLFLASQNLLALRSLSGEQDLEAPEWVVQKWGSAALLELATPSSQTSNEDQAKSEWNITIPTHLRYIDGKLHDNDVLDKSTVEIPWPILFWACEAEEGLKMSTNPFDRVNLGYDGLFGSKTMFYHIPAGSDVVSTGSQIKVPVLNPDTTKWTQIGTLAVVAVGFLLICVQLMRLTGLGSLSEERKHKKQ